jgi:hypothetical protein
MGICDSDAVLRWRKYIELRALGGLKIVLDCGQFCFACGTILVER